LQNFKNGFAFEGFKPQSSGASNNADHKFLTFSWHKDSLDPKTGLPRAVIKSVAISNADDSFISSWHIGQSSLNNEEDTGKSPAASANGLLPRWI